MGQRGKRCLASSTSPLALSGGMGSGQWLGSGAQRDHGVLARSPPGGSAHRVGDEGCCASCYPAQCPGLPFAGKEDEQCPEHWMLLCSLPASPSWCHSEGELITLLDCQRKSWSCGKGPRGVVGPGPGQSWFISVLRSPFPTSLEMSSRSPSGPGLPGCWGQGGVGLDSAWLKTCLGCKCLDTPRAAGTSVPGAFLSSCTRLPCREVAAGPGWSLSVKGRELRLHKEQPCGGCGSLLVWDVPE